MIGGKSSLIYTEPCLALWAKVWAFLMYLLSSSAKEEAIGTNECALSTHLIPCQFKLLAPV